MMTVALLRASLPSYFPDRHQIWDRCEAMVGQLCDTLNCRFVLLDGIATNGRHAEEALDKAEAACADFMLCLHGGFTMGDVARTLAARGRRIGFWSVPEPAQSGDVQLNSFVSLNMSLSIARGVRDLGQAPVSWYYGAPEDRRLQSRLSTTFRAISAVRALERARVGVIGGLAPTFYNMEVSTNALRARLGVETVFHDMGELTARMAACDPGAVEGACVEMTRAAPWYNVDHHHRELSARAALALRAIAAEGGYAALAVSDWPALQQHPGMHPGAAFSWVEETDDLPVASEGDLLGAVSQIVAQSLSGRTGALLDMTEPDQETGQLLVWHGGGGPLHLCDEAGARWINHPMIGRDDPARGSMGAIADFVFAPGPVTLLRIGRNAENLFVMEGKVVARQPSGFDGCRGWLEDMSITGQSASLDDVVATVLGHGIEHHFVLFQGMHTASAMELAAWTGMAPWRRLPWRDHLDTDDYI